MGYVAAADSSFAARSRLGRSIGIIGAGLLSILVLGACEAPVDGGSGTKKQPDTSKPAANDDSVEVVATTPKSCNALTIDGLGPGTVEASTETAPEAAGGELADGTYVFVKAVMYGLSEAVAPTAFLKSKIVLKNKVAETVQLVTEGEIDEAPLGTTETYEPNGTSLTIATTCPAGVPDQSVMFSAIEESGKTVLVLFHTSEDGVVGSFYEKQ